MSLAVPTDLEKEIDERITHYPVSKRSAVLPVLHALQHHFGYVSDEAVEWTARKLGLTPINVHELVTFYPMFRQQPLGKTHVKGVAIELGIHRHGGDSHLSSGSDDADCDLSAVGNQDLRKGFSRHK